MELESDVPALLDVEPGEIPTLPSHQSFHESSTNVSIADSAAATIGSESVRDCSDRGQMSSDSSESEDSDGSYLENTSNDNKPRSKGACYEHDMSSDEDWVEEPNNDETTHNAKCLFCTDTMGTIHGLLDHCFANHQFDLNALQKRHGMDQYSFIRLINFIRSCNITSRELMDMESPIWEQDKYMLPVIEDDPLLMYDFDGEGNAKVPTAVQPEGALVVQDDISSSPSETPDFSNYRVANAEGGHVTLTQAHFDDLHATLQKMQLVVDESNATLKQYRHDMEAMKRAMRHMVLGDQQKQKEEDMALARREEEDDEEDGYFSGYAHFSIHHDMLTDKPRTESYRDAILRNSHLIKDKVVLDLGCGTGILSMFAVQAGAEKVIGVDNSQIIFNAMAIIRENKMENKIKLVRGRIEEVKLSEPTVDVLVSEWMGYFLLFEGMLDSVIYARDKYLAPDGIILPNTCSIALMAVSDPERYTEMVEFWDDVYELKMSSMKPEVLHEASIETVPPEMVISDPVTVLELNLKTCTTQDTDFSKHFQLVMKRDGKLTAIAGSFDVAFNLDHTVLLSTSPYSPSTHWKQTVFFLPRPITVKAGQAVDCSIQLRRHVKESRWLDVTLVINGDRIKYSLS